MGRNCFQFEGGEDLTTMGACWFVSYAYYCYIDKGHLNWNRVSTYNNRISVYNRSSRYRRLWLSEIVDMSNDNLNKNTIGLSATDIKTMAAELLKKM